MKVYFHYEAQDTTLDYTRAFTLAEDSAEAQSITLGNLLQQFAAAYAVKHGRQLNVATAVLCKGNTRINPSSKITDVLSNGDDVLVQCNLLENSNAQHDKHNTSAAAGRGATATQESVTSQLKSFHLHTDPGCQRRSSTIAATAASTVAAHDKVAIATALAAAKQALAERRLRTAAAACASVLQRTPGHPDASLILADVFTAAGKPDVAAAVLQEALAAARAQQLHSHSQLQPAQGQQVQNEQQQQQYVQLLRRLGVCQVAAGRFEEALRTYQEALGQLGAQDTQLQLELQALCAAAMYPRGGAYAEAALQLVLEVLDSCESVACALRQYAVIAADKQLWADVVKVTVRLLVKVPEDKGAQQLLATAVQDSAGMQQLLQDVGSNPKRESAAALAYLAHIIKEHGAVQQAVQLYRLAVQLQPQSGSYALELAHALELDHEYAGVLQVVLQHCRGCQEQSVGPLQLQSVAQLPSLQQVAQQQFSICASSWCERSGSSRGDGGCDSEGGNGGGCSSSSGSSSCSSKDGCPGSTQHYSPQDLDRLALLFTAVKVLFVGGALAAAVELLQLCEVPWTASHEPLHCTHIRNEAAYAGCIKKLLLECVPGAMPHTRVATVTLPSEMGPTAPTAAAAAAAAATPIYLCGDSHCLSGAWRHITVAGQQRLLHPLLITGLKIWHLRPEIQHYAKHQFWAAVAAVPSGSQVVLLLGEIDCREGLLTAVEKLKYDSLQEAAAATVGVYVELLLQLVQDRGLQVYVHPVPPVLDETRDVVKLFETTMRRAVSAAVQQYPQVQGRLVYLEFFNALLSTVDKQSLQQQFSLDGTHLHPSYLEHLEASLNACGKSPSRAATPAGRAAMPAS